MADRRQPARRNLTAAQAFAAALTGPAAVSAAAHLAGLTAATLPGELVAAAQVVVGAAIGCRFAGSDPARVGRIIAASLGALVVLLAITVAVCLGLGAATGLGFPALLLAFAPGGLAEMTLVALALGLDPAFVTAHHVLRIFLVVLVVPPAFKAVERLARRAR